MRDRLIEMIRESHCVDTWNHYTDDFKEPNPIEELADYLLSNGVIVPPCKVGDTVYKPIITDDTHEPAIWDITITQISIDTGKLLKNGYAVGTICESKSGASFDFNDIGKTAFLTKEEAEKALKEGTKT